MKTLMIALLSLASVSSYAGVSACACQVYGIKSIEGKAELVLKTKLVKEYHDINENPMVTPFEDCVQFRGKRYFAKTMRGKVA